MRRILLNVSIILLLITSMFTLSGCGSKYCKTSGCPSESIPDYKYCYEHKCKNVNCKNEGIDSFSYCEECIERAQ